jgi:hypothetical protein
MHHRFLTPTLLATALGGALVAPTTAATLDTYDNDRAGFLAATGATSIDALPSSGGGGTTVGPVTFGNAASSSVTFGDWSNEISGFDLAITGNENFNLLIGGGGVHAIGFDWHEPMNGSPAPGCHVPSCTDSSFTIEVLAGSTSLGVFAYNAPNDNSTAPGGPLGFWGLHSSVLFDQVRVRETVGGIENEYFGNFVAGVSPVPELATAASLLAGLGLLSLGLRRRGAAAARA